MLELAPPTKKKKKRIVAVSWENRELLCLVASTGGSGSPLKLDHTLRVFCDDEKTDDEAAAELAQQLRSKRITSYELLIAIPRSQVDVITLKLPPATQDELPLLVRNEIMRQSADVSEDSLIDYEPPATVPANEAMTVDGAVVRGDAHARIDTITTALKQKASRIVVRAHAIASMFHRQVEHLPDYSMLLNVMRTSADISILHGSEIVFTRNVQLGSDGDEERETDLAHLSDEIRLTTIVAPQSEISSKEPVRQIFMFGAPQESRDFADRLAQEAQLDVKLLDPLRDVTVPTDLKLLVPSHRLAALIGMVWDFIDGSAQIDFANPKRPPERPNTLRKAIFYVTAAVAVIGIVGYRLLADVGDVQRRATDLQAEVEHSDKLFETVRKQTIVLDAVERWRQDQTDWLGELHYLASKLPPADKAVVRRLTFAPTNNGSGLISMSVQVADPQVIQPMENELRDERHQVSSQRIAPAAGDNLAVQFETRISVLPPEAPTK